MKVRYIGASDHQVIFSGAGDPRDVLIEGEIYEVEKTEVHTWHTIFHLKGIEGSFNSVCFEKYREEVPLSDVPITP